MVMHSTNRSLSQVQDTLHLDIFIPTEQVTFIHKYQLDIL